MKYSRPGLGNGEVEQWGSAGEKQIARMLTRYGIDFFYEHPVAVIDRGRLRIYYPDFWLPDYGVALEYAGVEGNDDYTRGLAHKKEVYRCSGIDCLYVKPKDLMGRWPQRILDDVHTLLVERLVKFDALENVMKPNPRVERVEFMRGA